MITIDPVCGMPLDTETANIKLKSGGEAAISLASPLCFISVSFSWLAYHLRIKYLFCFIPQWRNMVRLITNSRLTQVLLFLTLAFATPAMGETNGTDWFSMGMNYYNENKFEEAVKAYDNATKINPLDAEAWNNKGIAFGVLNRYDEAIEAFGEAVAINSTYAEAWYNMGAVFELQGRVGDAIRAYNEATKINPNYQKAWQAKNGIIGMMGLKNYQKFVHDGNS